MRHVSDSQITHITKKYMVTGCEFLHAVEFVLRLEHLLLSPKRTVKVPVFPHTAFRKAANFCL